MSTAAYPQRQPGRWPTWVRRLILAAATLVLVTITARLGSSLAAPPLPVLDTLGGELRLPSTLGRDLALRDLRGRPVLLNFGFTSCPDVCPTVLARLRAVLLDLDSLQVDTAALFVTLDPARDDLDTLARYLGHFHPALVGLRGPPTELARIAGRYRVHFERESLDGGAGYGLVHSSHIYLIDGQGQVRAMFGATAGIADMVSAVRQVAREGEHG